MHPVGSASSSASSSSSLSLTMAASMDVVVRWFARHGPEVARALVSAMTARAAAPGGGPGAEDAADGDDESGPARPRVRWQAGGLRRVLHQPGEAVFDVEALPFVERGDATVVLAPAPGWLPVGAIRVEESAADACQVTVSALAGFDTEALRARLIALLPHQWTAAATAAPLGDAAHAAAPQGHERTERLHALQAAYVALCRLYRDQGEPHRPRLADFADNQGLSVATLKRLLRALGADWRRDFATLPLDASEVGEHEPV